MIQAKRGVGRIWLKFKQKIESPIAAILIVNTIANTAGATVAGSAFMKIFGTHNLVIFSITFTIAVLFFSEILPKTLGVRYRFVIAPVLALPLAGLVKILKPLTKLTGEFSKMFYGPSAESGDLKIAQEINSLAVLARVSGHISPYEESLIKESYSLSETMAREVMIPAEDLAFLSTNMTLKEALSTTQLAGHSRYPLIEGEDRNKVLGYINFKELSIAHSTNPKSKVQNICRPILKVPPTTRASNLLDHFVKSHEHIAMVKEEGEGTNEKTLGMVTFEDILEEIAGEVQDQYDRLPRKAMAIDQDNWIVGGGIRMDELRKELNITAASIDNSPQQLAVWLIEQLGKTPRYNDRVAVGGFEFQVKRMRRGKASEIKVTRI
jgi:CBS domain containing-hemolysin-like protein